MSTSTPCITLVFTPPPHSISEDSRPLCLTLYVTLSPIFALGLTPIPCPGRTVPSLRPRCHLHSPLRGELSSFLCCHGCNCSPSLHYKVTPSIWLPQVLHHSPLSSISVVALSWCSAPELGLGSPCAGIRSVRSYYRESAIPAECGTCSEFPIACCFWFTSCQKPLVLTDCVF